MTKNDLIEFENKISQLWEKGDLPYLIHLSGGNEDWLIEYFEQRVMPGDWVFSTHRNHYHALLSGVNKRKLEDLIRTGKSMFVYDASRNFFTSSVLAGTCGIAAGVAWGLKQKGTNQFVHCFLGDGAEEQGHFYEAVMMVENHDLPCVFIIEDNDRSVDTNVEERLPRQTRMAWPKCVIRNRYVPTYPHAGNGTKKIIQFAKVVPR